MINGKFIFITRAVFIVIIASLFFTFIWYQSAKSDPRFIEARENFYIDHLYSLESGYLDNEALKSTAESLAEIFRLPTVEKDASMVAIEAGNNHNIVFRYQYAVKIVPEDEKKRLNDYIVFQKLRFCNNYLDRKRLKLLTGYDFTYRLGNETVLSFSITDRDCI